MDSTLLKVFISSREAKCDECLQELGPHAWITLVGEHKVACLSCADLDHLVFLPSGDAALTRRAQKHSKLSAVVLKWSRARKRYERQGLLVEEEALAQAEHACLKYSGRVGRSAEAKQLDENAVRLAVIAHIRHTETRYDDFLLKGIDRRTARLEVEDKVDNTLVKWQNCN
jgi:hypothetical protein